MHSQMSGGVSAPSLVPPPGVAPATPRIVPHPPKSPRKRWLGWIGFLILTAVLIERGVHFAQKSSAPATGVATVIRTAAITEGPIERTIRLTGTTGAGKICFFDHSAAGRQSKRERP